MLSIILKKVASSRISKARFDNDLILVFYFEKLCLFVLVQFHWQVFHLSWKHNGILSQITKNGSSRRQNN